MGPIGYVVGAGLSMVYAAGCSIFRPEPPSPVGPAPISLKFDKMLAALGLDKKTTKVTVYSANNDGKVTQLLILQDKKSGQIKFLVPDRSAANDKVKDNDHEGQAFQVLEAGDADAAKISGIEGKFSLTRKGNSIVLTAQGDDDNITFTQDSRQSVAVAAAKKRTFVVDSDSVTPGWDSPPTPTKKQAPGTIRKN